MLPPPTPPPLPVDGACSWEVRDAQVSVMESDDPPDTTIPNSIPEEAEEEAEAAAAPQSQSRGFSAAPAVPGRGFTGEEVDPEPVQLRCVLEVLNTGGRLPPPATPPTSRRLLPVMVHY